MSRVRAALIIFLVVLVGSLVNHRSFAADPEPTPAARLAELDAYWAEVSRCVGAGDFAGYAATVHPNAVIVSGKKQISYPLADALKRWKTEFDDTKAGRRTSSVQFRFSHRYGDATTAHEAGVFLYQFQTPGTPLQSEYIEFEALLLKDARGWRILMEYQKAATTKAAWDALE
jgi:hypothetical protein